MNRESGPKQPWETDELPTPQSIRLEIAAVMGNWDMGYENRRDVMGTMRTVLDAPKGTYTPRLRILAAATVVTAAEHNLTEIGMREQVQAQLASLPASILEKYNAPPHPEELALLAEPEPPAETAAPVETAADSPADADPPCEVVALDWDSIWNPPGDGTPRGDALLGVPTPSGLASTDDSSAVVPPAEPMPEPGQDRDPETPRAEARYNRQLLLESVRGQYYPIDQSLIDLVLTTLCEILKAPPETHAPRDLGRAIQVLMRADRLYQRLARHSLKYFHP